MIFLASGSAVRGRMLEGAGIAFERSAHAVDEQAVQRSWRSADRPAHELAGVLAQAKAVSALQSLPGGSIVIAADQVLVHRGEALSKVADTAEAAERLARLSGEAHDLVSTAVVARGAEIRHVVDAARINMRPIGPSEIASYLAEAPASIIDSVACYEIEGLGARLISGIEGDYFTALGLPLFGVLDALRALDEDVW